ncbi:MAG TPA: hypothetical protein VMO26_08905 [Vicinamibacterales bacterium]|nr:hypothetical protein [Vicinamibacterales bacterium]
MSDPSSATPDLSGQRQDNPPALRAQDTEQGGDTPDVNRPPDQDVPDFGKDVPDIGHDPAAPPFTGEDLEDTGRPRRRKRPQDVPNG